MCVICCNIAVAVIIFQQFFIYFLFLSFRTLILPRHLIRHLLNELLMHKSSFSIAQCEFHTQGYPLILLTLTPSLSGRHSYLTSNTSSKSKLILIKSVSFSICILCIKRNNKTYNTAIVFVKILVILFSICFKFLPLS